MLTVYHGCQYHHVSLDALQRVPFLSQLSLTILHPVSISSSCGYLNTGVSIGSASASGGQSILSYLREPGAYE
jgi:hypothetical protein